MIIIKNGQVVNEKGEPLLLNAREQAVADRNQRIVNELGFNIDITTLTTIVREVSEQKFFEIAPADYLPVRVGEGAWSQHLTTYKSFALGDDFETGILNTGGNNARLAVADAGVDSVTIPISNWAKQIGYTLFDLELAAQSGNWDLVTSKEESRVKNWQLGIQKVAFVGTKSGKHKGLYNLVGITPNTTVIPKFIGAMSPAELKSLVGKLIGTFRMNCAHTAWPTHFIIPENDYTALSNQASADFPIKSVLQLLEEAFRQTTKNAGFQILPNAYGQKEHNPAGKNRYILENYDAKSIRMDLPVDYTNTVANSIDNFSFQNVGYGQFTGVGLYRELEIMYFDHEEDFPADMDFPEVTP